MKKIGFVVPWYADNIPGGAEMLVRGLTGKLHDDDVDIEILTTCVREFASDWNENYYDEGETVSEKLGVVVRRFPVRKRNVTAFDEINSKFIRGMIVTPKEEEIFLKEMVNSTALYDYMKQHYDDYSYFLYSPYMFGTTYYGSLLFPEKSVLIPCFHDEAYFHMQAFADCFSKVKGLIYNALPEYELANTYYDLKQVKQLVLGTGVDVSIHGDPKAFVEKYKIDSPFFIYAGRKDVGKNVDTLLRYFEEYLRHKNRNNETSDLKLVLIGGGDLEIPTSLADSVIDLGFVPIQDKYDAMSAATFLCQPSHNESFSIVIMESWLCNRPVLVNEDCPVTVNFARQSAGGLYFKDYYDFEACLDYFCSNEQICQQMGLNGNKYVNENFSWDAIIRNFKQFFESLEENSNVAEDSNK